MSDVVRAHVRVVVPDDERVWCRHDDGWGGRNARGARDAANSAGCEIISVLSGIPATTIMLRAFALLVLFTTVLAIPFPLTLIGWHRQSPFSNARLPEPPKNEIGWVDPRILGGQFIDVTFLFFTC